MQVVGAEHEVDDLRLGDIVGVADDAVLHQVLAQELPGVGIADAEHGAEFCDGYHIRVEAETLFVILSCHDRFSFFGCVCGTRCAPLQSGYIPDGRRSDKMMDVLMAHDASVFSADSPVAVAGSAGELCAKA